MVHCKDVEVSNCPMNKRHLISSPFPDAQSIWRMTGIELKNPNAREMYGGEENHILAVAMSKGRRGKRARFVK